MEAAPEFFAYLTHPVMVGMAEEVVGGKVRLDESGIIINSALAPGEPDLWRSGHLGAPDHMPFEYFSITGYDEGRLNGRLTRG